ncbi:MAG: hypothetical protein V1899_05690 [Planctomycetota bacterium]
MAFHILRICYALLLTLCLGVISAQQSAAEEDSRPVLPTFTNVTELAGLKSKSKDQFYSWCDYNNDGFLDLLTFGQSQAGSQEYNLMLLKNNGNGNHWIELRFTGRLDEFSSSKMLR